MASLVSSYGRKKYFMAEENISYREGFEHFVSCVMSFAPQSMSLDRIFVQQITIFKVALCYQQCHIVALLGELSVFASNRAFFTISSFDLFGIYSKALSDCCLCIAFFVFVQPIVNYNFWFVAYLVLNNALWIHLHCLELRDRPSVTAFNLISSLGLRSGFMFVFNHWSWCEFSWCHLLIILTRDCFLLCLCVCVCVFFSNTDSQWESEQKGGAAGGPATPYPSNGRSSDPAKSSWFGS